MIELFKRMFGKPAKPHTPITTPLYFARRDGEPWVEISANSEYTCLMDGCEVIKTKPGEQRSHEQMLALLAAPELASQGSKPE